MNVLFFSSKTPFATHEAEISAHQSLFSPAIFRLHCCGPLLPAVSAHTYSHKKRRAFLGSKHCKARDILLIRQNVWNLSLRVWASKTMAFSASVSGFPGISTSFLLKRAHEDNCGHCSKAIPFMYIWNMIQYTCPVFPSKLLISFTSSTRPPKVICYHFYYHLKCRAFSVEPFYTNVFLHS